MVGRSSAFHGAAAQGPSLLCVEKRGVLAALPPWESVIVGWGRLHGCFHEQVPVINVSLVDFAEQNASPASCSEGVLAQALPTLWFPSVGNDGPFGAAGSSPRPRPGVVGVRGGRGGNMFLSSSSRAQVKFAAPGADMSAAQLAPGYALCA